MSNEAERRGPSLRAGSDQASTPPLADAPTAADNPAANTRRGGKRRKETLNGLQATGVALELLSEDSEETVDLKAVHGAVATLLVQYYRKIRSEKVTGGIA
jgi:hypothetical protein